MSYLSVRVRATLAATAIVAVALGVAAVVLVGVLRGSLVESTSAEAARRADVTAARLATAAEAASTAGRTVDRLDPDVQILDEDDLSADQWASATTRLLRPDVSRSSLLRPEVSRSSVLRPGLLPRAESGSERDVPQTISGQETAGARKVLGRAAAVSAERWAPADSFAMITVPVDTTEGMMLVQARASLEPTKAALQTLQGLLLPGIPALLLLVAALTWLAVGRALAPVSAIRTEMADITASDLHRRVPVPRSRDEIARLAETMNRTLDRLEFAVDRHKRFVADAAHELRSPLAVLRTRLELAPSVPLAAEALTDVGRIQSLTSDLLLLARLDAGEPACHEEVDLGQVTAEEAIRSRPRPEIHVGLEVAADVLVRGSAEELRRLVANLVDNAVRHADSTVSVRLSSDGDGAVLDVCDDGPGIPAEQREAVFDRFTRLDEARDRDAGGSGLGLAIARDIALRHGGSLRVAEKSSGARLHARFPVI
ncbi:sensor histidine kinase [Streptosporangium sp. NBC_01756]|uniref:sensor histidine kinase n=1 Tax=Streptosporangium sp. NBC_01756 TaxID=2975950 RepID=UPI002DD971B4|nr:ATP-binding protein [Streptosporangium sp. NBC_01756]WSC90300.1 ATP-binding protein [Streptosporangium sp. NBC_01756]